MIDYARHRIGSNDDILVIEVSGRLNNETSPFLFDCIEGEVDDGSLKVILDFEKLDHITSLGLGTLVRIHSRMKTRGGQVECAHVKGLAADVISAVGLNRLFHFHDTVEEAALALG